MIVVKARLLCNDYLASFTIIKPRPHQQQCRNNVRLCRRNIRLCWKKNVNNIEPVFREISFFRQSRNKLNMLNFSTLLPKTTKMSKQHSICRKDPFDNVASTLLLVWTGLYEQLANENHFTNTCRC